MKKVLTTISLATLLALSSPSLYAGKKHHQSKNNFEDYARVTHVDPVYKTVRVSTPQRECWQEPRYQSNNGHHKSYTSTIAGTIVGGALGNQFGGGNGKKIMTVAGALLGGSVGRDLGYKSQHNNDNYRGTTEQCRVTESYHEEQRMDGYNVTYRYQGQSYRTHMNHHPGKRIAVNVSVSPVHYY